MNITKCKCFFVFVLALTVAGIFSLLWIRQQVYIQASYVKVLEKELNTLIVQQHNADNKISYIQSNQFLQNWNDALQSPSSKQTIWLKKTNRSSLYTKVAAN